MNMAPPKSVCKNKLNVNILEFKMCVIHPPSHFKYVVPDYKAKKKRQILSNVQHS